MKRITGFFVALLLTAVSFSIAAQEQNALIEEIERPTYGDNWFISLGGNANLLLAEQDGDMPFKERVKFGGMLTVGKWFNPNFGARIQITGGGLRGWNDVNHYPDGYYVHSNYKKSNYPMGGNPADAAFASNFNFSTAKTGVTVFEQKFNYASVTFDLMSNFSNLMRGHYKEGSLIDVIPFAGLGVIKAFNNDVSTPDYYHFVAKLGVRVNFNINERFAIYIEPQANATPDEFDGYSGTAVGDGVANLGIGVQYTFNKGFTTMSQFMRLTSDEIDRLNRKINANRDLIDNHQKILERQQNLLERLEKCCEENQNKQPVVTQVVEAAGCLPEYVRFGLDKYNIEPTEMRKIVEVADYLKRNSSSRILIVGYADRKTGNPTYNLSLSKRRVDGVAAELRRLGISDSRIIVEWKGDREQPFPQNEWNRVVVMVERK